MMAGKARLFGDDEVMAQIMTAEHPREYKKLGRKVRNFNQKLWDENKAKIVLEGTLAKFSQNLELKEILLNTGDAVLVEASPYDHIWGIKMCEGEPGIENPNNWRGENLLGFILMEARDILRIT